MEMMILKADTAYRVSPRALAGVIERAIGYLAAARHGGWVLGQSRPFDWETDLPLGERRSWPAVCGNGRGRVFNLTARERNE